MATISDLANQVQARLEEPVGPGFWWKRNTEIYSGIAEAINEAFMLIGRPTQIVSQPFTIVPNTPFQQVPKGILCLTNIQGAASEAWKVTLEDLDYLQASWGSDWEQDIGDTIQRWAAVGFSGFIVNPCVQVPQTVLITGIAYPFSETWPYTGNENVPVPDEFFAAIEEYTAAYCRFKDLGNEASESFKLLQSFYDQCARYTSIQDRRDPYIFNRATGSPQQVNPNTRR